MLGLKEAGVAGATVVLAGGVAYLVWVYATSKQTGKRVETASKEAERKQEKREEEPVVAAAAAAPATKSSVVRRTGPNRTEPDHRPGNTDQLFIKEALNLCLFTFLDSLSSLSTSESLFSAVCVLCLQPRPLNPSGTKVLVLGLDGAGKTSLLHYWATGCLEQDVGPSRGLNAVSINKDDLHVEFLESEAPLCPQNQNQNPRSEPDSDSPVSQSEVERTCGPTGTCTRPRL